MSTTSTLYGRYRRRLAAALLLVLILALAAVQGIFPKAANAAVFDGGTISCSQHQTTETWDGGTGNTGYYDEYENGQFCLSTADGQHRAVFQSDGNFVVYHGSTATYQTNTYNYNGEYLEFTPAGNFVVKGYSNQQLWSSGGGVGGTGRFRTLVMQSDGNLVIYVSDGYGNITGGSTWSTKTNGK